MKSIKRVLLLQGPLGSFFAHLANSFSSQGIETHRICFNGGDRLYAKADFIESYRGVSHKWPEFLSDYILLKKIDAVFCYGDCRYYHKVAKDVSVELGTLFYAMEEGYLRPDYITFENSGNNANSPLVNLPIQQQFHISNQSSTQGYVCVGATFFRRMYFAITYYWAMALFRIQFPQYVHHRHYSVVGEGARWCVSLYRKITQKRHDPTTLDKLINCHSGRIFLVPLQVHNDFQLVSHSPFDSMEQVIERVVQSFSIYAKPDAQLLIKHHPMDRGFKHYAKYIQVLAEKLNLVGRIHYIFDAHLPSLYPHLAGTITVNSTVGLSALHHGVPTKVLGKSLYDIEGVTDKKSLEEFWLLPAAPQMTLFKNLKNNILAHSQINGCFYKYQQQTADLIVSKVLSSDAEYIVDLPSLEHNKQRSSFFIGEL